MSPDELGALQNFKFIFNGLDVHVLDRAKTLLNTCSSFIQFNSPLNFKLRP